jgi:hypothetical protein
MGPSTRETGRVEPLSALWEALWPSMCEVSSRIAGCNKHCPPVRAIGKQAKERKALEDAVQ